MCGAPSFAPELNVHTIRLEEFHFHRLSRQGHFSRVPLEENVEQKPCRWKIFPLW